MDYAFAKTVPYGFPDALAKTKAALAGAGFGVLTEIDVQATLSRKLGVAFDRYHILGACNPPLAHEALAAQKDIGLFLPCNVVVYEDAGAVRVAILRPSAALPVSAGSALAGVARRAEEKLSEAFARI